MSSPSVTTPPGHTTVPDQPVSLSGVNRVVTLTLTNPRVFRIITIVCQEDTNVLVPSQVTFNGETRTSIGTAPAGVTAATLCNLGGAQFEDLPAGSYPGNVLIQ